MWGDGAQAHLRSHMAMGSKDGELKGKSKHKRVKLGDDNTDNNRDPKVRKRVSHKARAVKEQVGDFDHIKDF